MGKYGNVPGRPEHDTVPDGVFDDSGFVHLCSCRQHRFRECSPFLLSPLNTGLMFTLPADFVSS